METIAALSSGHGKSGVAVIRISGPLTSKVLGTIAGAVPPPRKAALRAITDPRTSFTIDHGLVLWFPGPSSFTGEDAGELQIHGGRAVIAAALDVLFALGVRAAEPGEFARRAFENGKLDLTEAEGLVDLIDAETEAQRRQALRQAEGALGRLYDVWREELIGAMALVEAAIDFSDEGDVADDAMAKADALVRELERVIAAHLDDGHRGEILRDGFRVVLAGPPNAGKSSLLNALARREAAIVSAEPGTTRDPIEVRLDLEGLPVVVCDTAGLRPDPTGEIEKEGIRRTLARSRDADLVLWVIDGLAPVLEPPGDLGGGTAAVLKVVTKTDVSSTAGALADRVGGIAVSANSGDGLSELIRHMAADAKETAAPGEGPALTQARHRSGLEACRRGLMAYLGSADAGAEIRAEELRQAAGALGRLTGRVDAEDVLDQVFARFCIGK